MQSTKTLPDITDTKSELAGHPLQWVGMEKIAVPLTLDLGSGQQQTVAAKANVYVSLDDTSVKGIHMSRLHAHLNELADKTCNQDALNGLLENIVASQKGISKSAKVDMVFDLLLPKKSLLSDESGFQIYRVEINSQRLNNRSHHQLAVTIPYSSTCPCSAALARQLTANAIDKAFPSPEIDKQDLLSWVQATTVATPHSQRSYAELHLLLGQNPWPALPDFIRQVEEAIGTSTQTMVKRIDEQEFARLNANNLMFCEDAARKIKALLETFDWISDYHFKVDHQESLHAHNAVVIDQKYPIQE